MFAKGSVLGWRALSAGVEAGVGSCAGAGGARACPRAAARSPAVPSPGRGTRTLGCRGDWDPRDPHSPPSPAGVCDCTSPPPAHGALPIAPQEAPRHSTCLRTCPCGRILVPLCDSHVSLHVCPCVCVCVCVRGGVNPCTHTHTQSQAQACKTWGSIKSG